MFLKLYRQSTLQIIPKNIRSFRKLLALVKSRITYSTLIKYILTFSPPHQKGGEKNTLYGRKQSFKSQAKAVLHRVLRIILCQEMNIFFEGL
jgi:hypothetical protein